MRRLLAMFLGLLCVAALARPAAADTFVFRGAIGVGSPQNGGVNATGRGRQTLSDLSLGLDFLVVRGSVEITQLGVWDDNDDGLASDHRVTVFDTATRTVLASVATSASGGFLHDGFRYFPLAAPLSLAAGDAFTIVVYYPEGNLDSNGNSGRTDQALEPRPAFRGRGLIVNVGGGRFGFGTEFPLRNDTGPANRYHSGSFAFSTTVPEPVALLLALLALGAFLVVRR